MNYTPNLKLKKPLQEEYYDVDDFNYNADILDKYISEGMYANQSLYVNGTTGNDDNEGTESSPFLTIQKAVNTTLKLGDICLINVSAGTYPEDVLIPRLTAKYLEIRGAGNTTIVKSFTVNGCNGQYTRLLSLKVNGLNSSNVAISSGNGYLQVDSVTLAGSGTGYGITVSGGGFISNGFTVGGYNIGVQVAYGAVANLRSITFGTNTTDIHAYGGMVMTNSTTTKTNATYGGYIVNFKTATSLTTGVADKDTAVTDVTKKIVTSEFLKKANGWAFSSSSYITKVVTGQLIYTAPANGYITAYIVGYTGLETEISISCQENGLNSRDHSNTSGTYAQCTLSVAKGQTILIKIGRSDGAGYLLNGSMSFVYAKGEVD